mmetsp:Transcript_139400/g.445837  ORF Transcript_139400/g.445837 Transcript_139400/m.445837 type:complete len:322 (+) Transcript_139400:369-1334(+)
MQAELAIVQIDAMRTLIAVPLEHHPQAGGEKDTVGVDLHGPAVLRVNAISDDLPPDGYENVRVQRRLELTAKLALQVHIDEIRDQARGHLQRDIAENGRLVAREERGLFCMEHRQEHGLVPKGQHQRPAKEQTRFCWHDEIVGARRERRHSRGAAVDARDKGSCCVGVLRVVRRSSGGRRRCCGGLRRCHGVLTSICTCIPIRFCFRNVPIRIRVRWESQERAGSSSSSRIRIVTGEAGRHAVLCVFPHPIGLLLQEAGVVGMPSTGDSMLPPPRPRIASRLSLADLAAGVGNVDVQQGVERLSSPVINVFLSSPAWPALH